MSRMKRSDRSRGESGAVDGFEALGFLSPAGTASGIPEHPAATVYPSAQPTMAPPISPTPALFPGMFPPPATPAPNADAPTMPSQAPQFPAPTGAAGPFPGPQLPATQFPAPTGAAAQLSGPQSTAYPSAAPQQWPAPSAMIPAGPFAAPQQPLAAQPLPQHPAAPSSAVPSSAPVASPTVRASRIAGRPGSERFTAPTHAGIPASASTPLDYRPGLVEAPHTPKKRMSVGRRLLSAGVFAFIGIFIVGVSVPANAFFHPDDSTAALSTDSSTTLADSGSHQQVQVGDVKVTALQNRDGYTVQTAQQLAQERWWVGDGGWPYTITTGAIRWPFPYHVPISSGYGPRIAPCAGCSSFHEGDDFVPGAGAEIFTAFAGTVTMHVPDDWSYGNYVEIEAPIRGHEITAVYAHMKPGSSPLKVGEKVDVGQLVGLVGETGEATGPHLHFEIRVDGVKVDPYKWLLKNATNDPTVPQ